MRLSRQDRRALDEIGRGLRSDDPGLATALTATTDADADRRVWLAWPALWIGWVAMIAGFTAARGWISGGTIVGIYGLVLMLVAATTLLRELARRHGRRYGTRMDGVTHPTSGADA
jgi:hypothetical protein